MSVDLTSVWNKPKASFKERLQIAKEAAAAYGWEKIHIRLIPGFVASTTRVPCPKCGGNTRFWVYDDYENSGGGSCAHCMEKGGADGFGMIRHMRNLSSMTQAVELVERECGIGGTVKAETGYFEQPAASENEAVTADSGEFPTCHAEAWEDYFGGLHCETCNPPPAAAMAKAKWRRDDSDEWVKTFDAVEQREREEAEAKDAKKAKGDIVDQVAVAKKTSAESLRAYGAVPERRTWQSGRTSDVARVPMFGPDSTDPIGHFDLIPWAKGFALSGSKNGVYLPDGRFPHPGERWILVEGVKDASMLHSVGYGLTAGMPTDHLPRPLAELFLGCEITIVPDQGPAGAKGVQTTASNLAGIATHVRVSLLPHMVDENGDTVDGADVRDAIVAGRESELRESIANPKSISGGDESSATNYKPELPPIRG
ncbi:MAG: hypothetical protein KDB23_32220, partial [Planctomycetales bacterium]|nr:hypothetical protein [Planctomycetales bacterium]